MHALKSIVFWWIVHTQTECIQLERPSGIVPLTMHIAFRCCIGEIAFACVHFF